MEISEKPCPRVLGYKPPRIAMTLLAVAALLQFAVPAEALAWHALPLPGLIVAAIGFLLMMRAWWLFRVGNTAICPTERASILITDDVYRLTRNPMYLGMVLMLLGTGLFTGGALYYLAAVVFFAIIDHSFCPYEESRLRDAFGDEFVQYAQRVRRWL